MNIEIIKSLKERAKEMLKDNYDRKIGDEEIYTIICELENFYTAYEKEKEKNKQIKSKLDEKNIPIETLLAEFERLEDLEDDLTIVYLNGVYDGEKKAKDKIKAKREEVEQWELYNMKIPKLSTLDQRLGAKIGIKYVLQSLLGKE